MKISVIGLGKLGAPLAAVMASKGHHVVGVDVNTDYVSKLQRGQAPVFEPGLAELIHENRARLTATTDAQQAVGQSEVTFIVVATPSDAGGGFSLDYVDSVVKAIAPALARKSEYHLVVVTSTVMPGSMDGQVRPALERLSGKVCGRDFGLCYNPEFIALGSVIRDMLNPDFILIGQSDARAGELLAGLYAGVCQNRPSAARMSFVNAELTKIAVNTFVTTRISYANMIAQVCEHLPGADADVVTSALGLDSRIGKKYLKGAVSYGGPCFPRDNRAFAALARRLGTQAVLAEATDRMNDQRLERLVDTVMARLLSGGSGGSSGGGGGVAVLGLSYKPQTDVVEASAGLRLVERLLERGVPVVAYDPAGMDNAKRRLGQRAAGTLVASMKECVRQGDVIVLSAAWEEFRGIGPEDLARAKGRATVIDCWRLLDRAAIQRVADYVVLGVGPCEVE